MARTIRNIKLGQEIVVRELGRPENQKRVKLRVEKWRVTEIYSFFVTARRWADGVLRTRTFNLGELVQMGYEPKGVLF